MTSLLDVPTWKYALGLGIFLPIRIAIYVAIVSFFVFKTKTGQNKRVYRVPFFKGQFKNETTAALKIAAFDVTMLVVIHALKLFHDHQPTVLNVATTLGVTFLWTEVWYYCFHRLAHTKRFFFIHAQHHVAQVSHPMTFLSFSILERAIHGLMTLMLACLLSNYIPIPFYGIAAYQFVFIMLDLVAHTNVEFFPAGFPDSILGKFFYSPTFHAMHHARYKGNYGLFTSFMDRIFGSAFSDYPELFNLAREGRGPASLQYRAVSEFVERETDILAESMLVADSEREPMIIRVQVKLKVSAPEVVDDKDAQLSALTKIILRSPELTRSFEMKLDRTLERRPSKLSEALAESIARKALKWEDQPFRIGHAPLFRIKLDHKDGFQLIVHHALLDGRTSLALAGELFKELVGVSAETQDASKSRASRAKKKSFLPQLREYCSLNWQMITSPPVLLGPRNNLFGTGNHIFAESFLEKSELRAILANARRFVSEVSVNDVMLAALHLAVQRNLNEQSTPFGGSDRISVMIPVDLGLGDVLGNGHEKFRHQASSVSVSSARADRKDPITLLSRVKTRMDHVKSGQLATAALLRLKTMKLIGYLRVARRSQIEKGAPYRSHTGTEKFWRKVDTILFANVGNVRFHRTVDPWIDRVVGYPPVLPPMGVGISVGVREEGLFFYLHASDATFNQAQADQFLKSWIERMRDYLGHSELKASEIGREEARLEG